MDLKWSIVKDYTPYTLSPFLPLPLSLSLCVSLTYTHTCTHTHTGRPRVVHRERVHALPFPPPPH